MVLKKDIINIVKIQRKDFEKKVCLPPKTKEKRGA